MHDTMHYKSITGLNIRRRLGLVRAAATSTVTVPVGSPRSLTYRAVHSSSAVDSAGLQRAQCGELLSPAQRIRDDMLHRSTSR